MKHLEEIYIDTQDKPILACREIPRAENARELLKQARIEWDLNNTEEPHQFNIQLFKEKDTGVTYWACEFEDFGEYYFGTTWLSGSNAVKVYRSLDFDFLDAYLDWNSNWSRPCDLASEYSNL